jgi:anionic glutamate receptor
MYVRNILALDEKHHTFKVQLTFRQEWTDERLSYTSTLEELKYLPYHRVKDLWVPDLFFSDEINSEEHELMTDNKLVRIFPNGHILYSSRVTLELFCPTDFNRAEIVCPIRIASYGYTSDEIDIKWSSEDPVQITKNVVIPEYVLNGVTTSQCDSKTKTGTYSCINADFKFGHTSCHA